jgi:L-ascorbate metabolism protein UlaG (beta-lactamase superfamily)
VKLTKYTHACVRIEDSGAVLVIDPGQWSEPESVDGADAVLVTHEHFDHLDVGKLVDALARRPSVTVYTNSSVASHLAELGDAVTVVSPGERFTAAGFPVRVYGGLHAVIHPELPRVANLAFLVEPGGEGEAIYHPGDSFDLPTDADVEIGTVFVPVAGPWMKMVEAVDFVRRLAPRRAFPLHDGLLSEAGHGVVTGNMQRLCRCDYQRLTAGVVI